MRYWKQVSPESFVMHLVLVLLFVLPVSAWGAGTGDDDARHLLTRTGFAPTESEIQEYATLWIRCWI